MVPVVAYCQEAVLSGTVRDGQGTVPYATVIFSNDSTARSVISYAVTDDNGKFAAGQDKPFEACWITVRCIGYDTYRRHWHISEGSTVDIKLSENATVLSEITVKGNMYGVSVRNDTVVYNPNAFANGSEQSLEDVVKKMPGMTVDESGNVSYQGKKIEKFLIDGKDVISGSNTGALRTLPSDFATSMELIANYSDGGVENAFKAGETMALNIKSGKQGKLSGALEGGGGIKGKFGVKSSLLKVGERNSFSALANANNTNEPVFSLLNYINTMGGLENIGASSGGARSISLSSNSPEQRMLLPADNEYEKPAGIGNINVTLEPSDKYRLTIGSIYHHSKAKSSSYNEEEYYLSDSGNFTNLAESHKEQSDDFASLMVNQAWKMSDRTEARAYTKISYGDYDVNGNVSNSYSGNDIRADEYKQVRSWDATQQIAVNTLVGRGLLFGRLDFNLKDAEQDYTAATNALLPETFAAGDGYYLAGRDGRDFSVNAGAGLIYPVIGDRVNLRAEAKGGYALSDLNTSKASVEEECEELHTRTFSLYGGLMKNQGLFRFDAGTNLSYYSLDADLCSSDRPERKHWHLEPVLAAALYFSRQHALSLSMSHALNPAGISALSRTTMLNGYNNIQQASECSNLLEKKWEAVLSYKYFSLFSRTTLFVYATYNKVEDTYRQDYSSEDITTYVKNTDGGGHQSVSSTFYFNKGLASIPLDFKVTANHTYSSYDMLRNSVPLEMRNNTLNTSAEILSRFKSFPVNFEVSGLYNLTGNRIEQMDIHTTNREYGGNLRLIYARGAFSASLTGKWKKVSNGSSDYNLNDADILLSYKVKRFRLKVSGADIFHLDKREWLTETVTPNVKSYIQYRQHNGYLLCSLSYSL